MYIYKHMNPFSLFLTHKHTHTTMAHWPADCVGLMYFDDMKVDHIYMQIEVPD